MTDQTVLPAPTTEELVDALRAFAEPSLRHVCDCRFCKASLLVRAWDANRPAEDIAVERVR